MATDMAARDPERGRRIQRLRRERGFTSAAALADAMGVHPRSPQNWEAGKPIDGPNLARLAEVLGTTPAYVWTGDQGEPADAVAVLRGRVDRLEGTLTQDGDRAIALRAHDKRVEDELAAIRAQLEALAEAQQAAALVLPDLVSASLELREEVAALRRLASGAGSSAEGS